MTDYLTIPDLMRELKVGRTTAYRIAHLIGVTRVASGAIRVSRSSLEQYLAERKSDPVAPAENTALAEAKALGLAMLRKLREVERS